MNFRAIAFAAFVVCTVWVSEGNAEPVRTFFFSGTVTGRTPSPPFSIPVEPGDSVSGSFLVDYGAPVLLPIHGGPVLYPHIADESLEFTVQGIQLTQHGHQIEILDNLSGQDLFRVSGSTVWVDINGNPHNGSLYLTLQDSTGAALTGTELPDDLVLPDFDSAFGTIISDNPGGVISFEITEIHHAPEPSSLALGILGAACCFFRRRRSK